MKKAHQHVLTFFLFAFVIGFSAHGKNAIKVLAIGNSFSRNAVEQNLYELAAAVGDSLVVGNVYFPGCSVDTHWNNARSNNSAYEFAKIVGGKRTNITGKTLAECIEDEDWDYISFQQASPTSGLYNSFTNLPRLMAYVKEKAKKSDVKFMFHCTWAYAQSTSHGSFPTYKSDQMYMYEAIINATNKIVKEINEDNANPNKFTFIIPAGTAVQNGRSSVIGDFFCISDGYHLNGVGQYTAACTWLEMITGKSAVGNTYKPGSLNSEYAEIAQNAAHYAVLKPNEITSISGTIPEDNTIVPEYPINVNFGKISASSAWNNITPAMQNISDLKDSEGNATGTAVMVTDGFSAAENTAGPIVTDTPINMPSDVSANSLWGNEVVFSGATNPTAGFKLSRLNKNLTYDIFIFSSRTGASDNRETWFKITDRIGDTDLLLNASGNTSNIVMANDLVLDDKGEIHFLLKPGPNNNNANRFFYINAIQLTAKTKGNSIDRSKNASSDIRIYFEDDICKIESSEISGTASVFAMSGQCVKTNIHIKNGINWIDMTELREGFYVLTVADRCIHFLKK